jgi:NAD dependent epimerase/dehydratase family enzyme
MARPFRMGVANWLGDGRQWLSWIQREDVIAAVEFLLQQDSLTGPFNLTAPGPVTSREFCEAMKRHHRTLVTAPVPASVMRLLVGEMADELLLHGQRVVPSALQAAGFEFRYPALDDALAAIC